MASSHQPAVSSRLFIYEWVTGGGMLGLEGRLPASLLVEGLAMVQAVAEDGLRASGVSVSLLRDLRIPQLKADGCELQTVDSQSAHDDNFERLCGESDAVLLIAPEIDGVLASAVRRAEQAGARLASPRTDFVTIASDKHRTAVRLAEAGVATPRGAVIEPNELLPEDFPYPAVVKPLDGAGSQDVYVVASHHDTPPAYVAGRRIEEYVPGTAASVAVLAGPAGITALPPCRQRLSTDGRLRYLGGATPLAPGLAERAATLAVAAVGALPPARGYVGVDLVLGADPSGAGDRVIEVNPRLTTSYAGLRFAVEQNLAELMLAAAAGQTIKVSEVGRPLEFGVDGTVCYGDGDQP